MADDRAGTGARNIAVVLTTLVAVFVAVIVGAYKWANMEPKRPRAVSPNAVFLWAPYVGFPGPRRGWWMVCWEDNRLDYCRLSSIDGQTEYEGQFVPYGSKNLIPAIALGIDPAKTREHKVWVGQALVPLVYLKNGEILVPASKREEATRLLDDLKSRVQ